MAKIKVGINGLGRIGRTVLRQWFKRSQKNFEITAVNNLGNPEAYVHLLRFDSTHGRFNQDVKLESGKLIINDHKMDFTSEKDPSQIPWDVDLVIDATGVFKDKNGLGKHLKGNTKKVIMCAPGKDLDGTFVMGINNSDYKTGEHHIVSNASCTTNCLAPVAKVLNDKWGIETGLMTTVHSYTLDQQILDAEHSDLRRSRAAAVSMIPTTTGAAKALGLVIPSLKGKLDGYAVRVPTQNVSMVDLTANLKTAASIEDINKAMKEASEGALKGILGYSDGPLVSVDFMGTTESSYFDSGLTNVIEKTVKVISWYDNEVGFSNRVVDLASHIGGQL